MEDVYILQKHDSFVRQIKIIENDMQILSYDVMGHFHLWQAEDGATLISFDRHAFTFILSTDCQLLVTARGDNWYEICRGKKVKINVIFTFFNALMYF